MKNITTSKKVSTIYAAINEYIDQIWINEKDKISFIVGKDTKKIMLYSSVDNI